MSFEPLPRVVKPGDRLFLNDGLVQLIVDQVEGKEVGCTVTVGGELRSRKGLNLPGINLGISAFTDHDRKCLEFALAHGVDAISQSFVESGADIEMVRAAGPGPMRALTEAPLAQEAIQRQSKMGENRKKETYATRSPSATSSSPRRPSRTTSWSSRRKTLIGTGPSGTAGAPAR